MLRALDRVDAFLIVAEKVLVYLAVLATIATVIVMVGDVGARYLLHSPLPRAYEAVNYYLMPAGLAFAFPICYRYREHIRIELFRVRVGKKTGLVLDRLCMVGSFIAAAAIGYYGLEPLWEGLRSGESIPGTAWPMWPAYATIPIAFGVLSASILVEFLRSMLGASIAVPAHGDPIPESID